MSTPQGGRGNHPISATLEGFISRREAGEGSLLGEAAFFTEVPQLEVGALVLVSSVSVSKSISSYRLVIFIYI